MQLADGLELDELQSARLLVLGQELSGILDRPALACAIIHFHQTRQTLLDCLRILLRQSQDVRLDEDIRHTLLRLVGLVLETKDGTASNGSSYTRKCFAAMEGCEKWLYSIAERIQGAVTLGQASTPTFKEIMDLQQESLTQQHEALGAIVTYLVEGGYTIVDNFLNILDYVPTLNQWGAVAVHYVPILISFTRQFGFADGSANLHEARSINTKLINSKESRSWGLTHLQAAMTTWWLAEYSGFYFDQIPGSPIQGVNLEAELISRTETFFQALHDGALQCTLSICLRIRSDEWNNPARTALTRSLLGDAPTLPIDATLMTSEFQELIMEQFDNFTTAFITNMPDTLRRFKVEEDDQRRRLLASAQNNIQNGIAEHDRHLERFLVIMSYAYEERADAAESFWTDTDGNLYGFLQWASRRQSTPCVSAFCELFRAISVEADSALSAHKFLLEESSVSHSRYRRSISLSWSQMFEELDFYASKIREHPVATFPSGNIGLAKSKPVEIDEPESPVMLECYLRLIGHLCSQNEEVRSWVLAHPTFHVIDILFALSSNTIPSRIRACAYATLRALLSRKTLEFGFRVWTALDQWVTTGFSHTPGVPRPTKVLSAPNWAAGVTFETVSSSFEEANAFVLMLQALVTPSADTGSLNDALQFPEQLGTAYRMAGIEPYIDVALNRILAGVVPQLEILVESRILSISALEFAISCLSSFNDDLIIIANSAKLPIEDSMRSSSLATYIRLHPFSRTMEWFFNDRVIAVLFSTAIYDISSLTKSLPDSPMVIAVLRSIEVMTLVMNMQSTFLDIVRPSNKSSAVGQRQSIMNPSLASFEDNVANYPAIIVALGMYCGSGHDSLVLASLTLLEKLSTSRKLNAALPSKRGSKMVGNRLVGILQQNNDQQAIAKSLIAAMAFDERELNLGPNAPGYNIKLAILNFLEHTLRVSPEKANIAHILLGFECTGDSVIIGDGGLFAHGLSLFHAIVQLINDYPSGNEESLLSWFLILKQRALQILKTLWTASSTSSNVMSELRGVGFLSALWMQQVLVDPSTSWDGLPLQSSSFCFTEDSVMGTVAYFGQRRVLLEYSSSNYRLLVPEAAASSKMEMLSTFLGSTMTAIGAESNLSLFDVLDFLELNEEQFLLRPETNFLVDLDLTIGSELAPDGVTTYYNLNLTQELLDLMRNLFLKNGRISDEASDVAFMNEAHQLLLYLNSENNRKQLSFARMEVLVAWVDLATILVESEDLDENVRSSLVLQTLQVISPKLEFYVSATRPEALILSRFVQILLAQLAATKNLTPEGGRAGDVTSDRLFQVFRISLRGIHNTDADGALRETLYNVCYRYLTLESSVSHFPAGRRPNLLNFKDAGTKLIDIISDDAYGGEGTCRVTALLLLEALNTMAIEDGSTYMVESMMRTNFIVVLVESIDDIPRELRETPSYGKFCMMIGYAPV